MECVVLTYAVPHRKTYDTLCRLKSLGYNNVLVWAVPLHYKKKFVPLYEHRPPAYADIETKKQCVAFGYSYIESANGYEGLPGDNDVPVLMCGGAVARKNSQVSVHYKFASWIYTAGKGLGCLKMGDL